MHRDKSKIVNVLSEKGLKVDPSSFIEYICESSDDLPEKMQFIKRMINNGSQLRGDAANTYLERTSPSSFSAELFALIFLQVVHSLPKGLRNTCLK